MEANQQRINLYTAWGKLDQAELYCYNNLELLKETGHQESDYTYFFNLAYQALGDIAYKRGQYQKAIDHYNYTIEIENEMAAKQNRPSIIWSIYSRLSKSYRDMGLLDKAHLSNEITHSRYLEDDWIGDYEVYKIRSFIYTIELDLLRGEITRPGSLISVIKRANTRTDKHLWQCQFFEAEIERIKGNYDVANYSLTELLDTSVINNMTEDFYPKVLHALSQTAEGAGDYEEAADYIDLAIQRLDSINSDSHVLRYNLIKNKIELLYNNQRTCEAVRLTTEHLQDFHSQYYPLIQSEVHHNLMVRYNQILEKTFHGIKYECTELVDLIPFLMESNKSISLINQTSQNIGINATDNYQIKALNSQIEYLKRSKLSDRADKYIDNRIFELKDTLKHLLQNVDIENARRSISAIDSDAYYLFLWEGEENIYAFHKKDAFSNIISMDKAAVAQLNLSLDLTTALSDLKSNYKQLYALLEFDESHLDIAERLIVSPHGFLENISFDCLIHDDDFLITKIPISYTPSDLYFNSQQEEVKDSISYLFVLPDFPPSPDGYAYVRSSLYHLPYAREEVNQLNILFPTATLLEGQEATKQNIADITNSHDIIHFATHAKTYNERDNALSFVAFTNTENDKETSQLYLNEIKNLSLDVEMVVLSACETGLGNNISGEVTSLARSFMVAGARSVISTLWTINDQSNAQIMNQFYEHLKEGHDKGQAMRQAKLDYLFTVDPEYTHPYYWAAMKVQGNNAALYAQSLSRYFVWCSIAIVGLLAFVISRVILLSKSQVQSSQDQDKIL